MERQLSNEVELREKYKTLGVVLFIFNNEGQVLTTIENLDYPETEIKPGQFSVICESAEVGETCQNTVIRGLQEELGLTVKEIEKIFKVNPESSYVGEVQFLESAYARVTAIFCFADINQLRGKSMDGEIEIFGWLYPEELLSRDLRTGVRNVLQVCLNQNVFAKIINPNENQLLPLNPNNLELCFSSVQRGC